MVDFERIGPGTRSTLPKPVEFRSVTAGGGRTYSVKPLDPLALGVVNQSPRKTFRDKISGFGKALADFYESQK